MAEFRITCVRPEGGRAVLLYDNQTNTLLWEKTRQRVAAPEKRTYASVTPVSEVAPGVKVSPRVLKISLGLLCNYACGYCSQRFVPHDADAGLSAVEPFLAKLPEWFDMAGTDGHGGGLHVEFWGGEPLVYWKTMKPLAEALRERMPAAVFHMVTNGSLLDAQKNEWLDLMGFRVAISHDGPGQSVRGPDPLDDPEKEVAIRDLYARLHPDKRISFNPMIHRRNQSRAAIQQWFVARFGDSVTLGEGGFIDPYDKGGASLSLRPNEHIEFRSAAFRDIRTGCADRFVLAHHKVQRFVEAVAAERGADTVGQKCGMDLPDHLAVTLQGDVVTCQNVTTASRAPNGQPHRIGTVDRLDEVRLNTATHWSHREECSKCPVLLLCGGSCMFLQGKLFDMACENAFSDNVAFFAAAIEYLTGMVPVHVEGPQRDDRHWLWGRPG